MNLELSDDQRMLLEATREFLSEQFPVERIAESADGAGLDAASWEQVAELGWTGISVAEQAGGAGLGFVEEALVIEELGRALFPGPYFSTVVLALPALAHADDLVQAVLEGTPATVAWVGQGGRFTTAGGLPTAAVRCDDAWRLTGETLFVPDLAVAAIVVVAAQTDDGVGLWAIDKHGGEVDWSELPTVDTTRRLGALALTDTPGRLLAGPGATGADVLASIFDRAHAALAAEAAGVASRALQFAVEHARSRQQFGRAIGGFQAVSHELADAYVQIEGARSLAYWAAWAVANGKDDAPEAAAAAKAYAAETAVLTCERAIQVLGGIGFTWEHPLHRYYKRALWISAFLGWPARQRAQIATSLLDRHPVRSTPVDLAARA